MTYTMLGLFSFAKENSEDFLITFEIPDNCFYEFTIASGVYTIAIKLNPGQTLPSTTFMECKEKACIINKTLVTNFEQYLKSGVVIKKPKANIEF
jgi:hypothetical protein